MYIKDIIMDGFKCYSERTIIKNLDRNFTAITGMNGSGKSNVIDAIIFALDLNSPKLMRVSSLKELINIHRKDCTVTLIFNNKCKASSPSGYEHFDEVEISRSMDHESKSKYKINAHSCTKATIEKLCKSIGISNDFIVMQGHITKILNMKPVELRNMIEETAGTRSYNDEKERSKELLEKKEIKLREAQEHLKRRISPFVKELMSEKKVYEENKEFELSRLRLVEELEKLDKARNTHNYSMKISEIEELLKSYDCDKKELDSIEGKLKEINEAGTEVDLFEIKARISEERIKLDDLNKPGLKETLQLKEEELKSMNIDKPKFDKQSLLDRESILSKELCNDFSIDKISELDTLKVKESNNIAELNNLTSEIQTRIKEIIKKDFMLHPDLKQEIAKYPISNATEIKTNIEDIKANAKQILDNIENKLESKSELDKKIQYLQSRIVYPFIKGVFGTVDELFDLKDEKFKEAIFTILGGRSKYIICENDEIASELLKSSDRKISCIPLNKITVNESKKLNINGINAIEAIKFDRKYEKAFNHIFGSFYIFNSKEDAHQCCYQNKVLCITLDGTVYDPKGTLTGGKSAFTIDIIRKSDIDSLKQDLENISDFIPEEYELNKIRQLLVSLNTWSSVSRSIEEYKNKIVLLEKICHGKFDIKSELDQVRRELIEASKEESFINRQKQQKDRKIKEINETKLLILNNEKSILESTKKLAEYQNILRDEELRNNSRRVSVRMVEGLDLKRKNLIKSTVKWLSRISKIAEELLSNSELGSKENSSNNCKSIYNSEFIDIINHYGFNINPSIFAISKQILDKDQIDQIESRIVYIKDEISKKRIRNTMDPKSFELLEKNSIIFSELEDKIYQLEKDKEGIIQSIEKLSDLGQKENIKAFGHINQNIGKFLRYFLPSADANITSEFEIRVKIGTWKNSLSELSGGQRSLVALCLIFSMLTYKPAPFYIFDEIDAALDLNYTQRIGEIIQNEFSSAQFIIVSLKNNMFDNANKIFKVFIQDQKSKVCQIK